MPFPPIPAPSRAAQLRAARMRKPWQPGKHITDSGHLLPAVLCPDHSQSAADAVRAIYRAMARAKDIRP